MRVKVKSLPDPVNGKPDGRRLINCWSVRYGGLTVPASNLSSWQVKWLDFGRRRPGSTGLLYVGMAVFAAAYILFYPKIFAIVDEDAYLTQAFLLKSGHLTYESSEIPAPHMTVAEHGRLASKYPPGNSLFLVPFVALGWHAVFAAGLLLALVGTLLFRLVLRRLDDEADPGWSLLWLFYPAVVLFSRTLMSDLLAATLTLAAFYCLLRRGRWLFLAGLALGFACLVRYANVVLVLAFLVLALRPKGERLASALRLLAGVLPFAAAIAGYNWYAFGGPLQFPMYLTGFFSPVFLPGNAAYYAVNLLLLYPLMLFAPFAAGRNRRLLLALPAFAVTLLYCFFSYIHESPSWPERLTVGMRYLLPAAPFFVLGFVIAADDVVRRLRGMAFLKYAGIGTMLALSIAIQYRHDRYLRVQEHYRDLLYRLVPARALVVANADVSELISYAWGKRDWRHFAEFNVPMPVDSEIAAAGSVYAGVLEKPGDDRSVEAMEFEALLARYPARTLVSEERSPYRFRLYRLK